MLLLDTNILYRWLMGLPLPADLVQRVREDGATVSILSPWEMLIKQQIGKLELPTPDVAGTTQAQGFSLLPVKPAHLLVLHELPLLHRDPFDRLLLAQAKAEGMMVVSTDRVFADYLPDAWLVP